MHTIDRVIVSILVFTLLLLANDIQSALAASDKRPHEHQGVLKAFDGRHLSFSLTSAQKHTLSLGEPVVMRESQGKSGGRGMVIQDVHASPETCMDVISNLAEYHKYVPKVKRIEVYSNRKLNEDGVEYKAKFVVGFPLLSFTYYLTLKQLSEYNTLSWTLDYSKQSDFDDNTGHWQVMPHPTNPQWSRVLFSTEVKLYSWVPEFVVNFLTKTALVESTGWVKMESEKLSRAGYVPTYKSKLPNISQCQIDTVTEFTYDSQCANRRHGNEEL